MLEAVAAAWVLMQSDAYKTGYEAGRTFGPFLWAILLVAGLLKCNEIAKRPTANAKCAYGLAFVLIGLLVGVVVQAFGSFDSPLMNILPAVVMFVLVVIGAVLAVVGLVELRSTKTYVQGRTQASWALVLTLLFMGLFGWGLYAGFTRAREIPDGMVASREAPAGGYHTVEEFNYRYRNPGVAWVKMNAAKLNPLASLALVQGTKQQFVIVIAEAPGTELFDGGMDAVLESLRATLVSVGFSMDSENPYAVREMMGVRMRYHGQSGGLNLACDHWVFAENGYIYQVILRAPASHGPALYAAADGLLDCFERIDAQKVAHADALLQGLSGAGDQANARSGERISKRYGYRVTVPETSPWLDWPALADDFPEAQTGMLAGDTAAFVVVPVWTRESGVPMESIAEALFDVVDVACPSQTLRSAQVQTQGDTDSMEIAFDRQVGEESWKYRFHLRRRGAFAWLAGGWWQPRDPQGAKRLEEALGFFALDEQLPEAPDLAQAGAGEKDRHSAFFNELGLRYYNKRQYAKALDFFRAGFETGKPDAAILGNVAETFAQLRRAEEGLAYIEKHASKFPGDHGMAVRRAEFLMQLGRTAQALDAYAQAFGDGWVDDVAFADLVRALNRAGRMDDALRWLDTYAKRSNTSDVQILRAETLRAQKKDDEAVAVLAKLLEAEPRNAGAVFALIDLHAGNERHREALELCTKAIGGGLASADMFYAKGDAECGLKWYRDAKASFEEALRRSPNDEEIQAYLDYLNGLLGEGANTAIKTPIPEVPLPEELAKDPDPAANAAYLKDAGAYYLLRATGVAFKPGEPTRTTEYLKAKVVETRSLEAFSTFQFAFDPLGEAIYVNRLSVLDGDGKLVSEGRVEAYYVLDHPDQEMATNDKLLTVPVPGLQVGYTVELVVTRRDFAPGERFPFARRILTHTSPVLAMAYWIQGDLANVKTRALRLPEPVERDGVKLWRVVAPEIYRWEPLQDEAEEFLPMLYAGDARDDWAALGRKHLDEMKEKLALDENTRLMAAGALQGIEGRPEKIRAAVKFIQDRLTYRAIEFGERARIPNDTARIMKDRYGDCKDHALLLHLILKDAGVPSHLTLVSVDTPVNGDFPSLDQFDHMIVGLPGGIGGDGVAPGFVDPTDHDVNPLDGAPVNLERGLALLLDPAGPRLLEIPAGREASVNVKIERDCRPDPDGGLHVAEKLALDGACAVDMRAYLRGRDAEGVKNALKADLEYARLGVELSGAELHDFGDNALPLRITLDYRVKEAAWRMEDQWVAVAPVLWERLYASAEAAPERRTPFRRRRALAIQSVTTIQPPEGYALAAKDLGGAGDRKPFVSWALKAAPDGTGVKLDYRLRLEPGRFGKERYGEYKAAMDAAAEKLNARLPWKKAAR